jgi:hypothetical protein
MVANRVVEFAVPPCNTEAVMVTLKEKTARLAAVTKKMHEFVANGGDIHSPEAAPIGAELFNAANDVGKDLGYELLKPTKKPSFDKGPIKPDPTSQR